MDELITIGLILLSAFFCIKWLNELKKQAKYFSNVMPSQNNSAILDALARLDEKIEIIRSHLVLGQQNQPSQPTAAAEVNVPLENTSENFSMAPLAALTEEITLSLPEIPPAPLPISPIPFPMREKAVWEQDLEKVLKKIWDWFLVGEAHRPKGASLEFALASTWLMRIGIVVLVSCFGWFLKWSMDHGILAPGGRVGMILVTGASLMVFGYRQMGKKFHVMGQGFMGGGLAALYFAAYAAGPLYHLISQPFTFGVMALVTLVGCVLASVTFSQTTAILAMLGGYLTPLFFKTDTTNFVGLYTYLFLLGSGIFGLALFRNWRILHYLSFILHWSLIAGSLTAYQQNRDFTIVIVFLVLFFIQQHAVTMGYSLKKACAISLLEAISQAINIILFTGTAFYLTNQHLGHSWPAVISVLMAAFFLVQTAMVYKRIPNDRLSISLSLGTAGVFIAWSLPLLFSGSSLTICWSLMALAWLWSGLQVQSKLLVLGSQILFLLAGAHLAAIEFPNAFLNGSAPESFGKYFSALLPRLLNFGIFLGSLGYASVLYRKADQNSGSQSNSLHGGMRISSQADLPINLQYQIISQITTGISVAFLFVLLHFEFSQMFSFVPGLTSPMILLLWVSFAWYTISKTSLLYPAISSEVGYAIVALIIGLLVFFHWPNMGMSFESLEFNTLGWPFIYRCISQGALIFFLIKLMGLKPAATGYQFNRQVYSLVALVMSFSILTLETRTAAHFFFPQFSSGALSIVWAAFAMSLIGAGLKWDQKYYRIGGLALFSLVVGKVFLHDLASLEMIWRVLSFLVVGALLLFGSFAYIRASGKKEI